MPREWIVTPSIVNLDSRKLLFLILKGNLYFDRQNFDQKVTAKFLLNNTFFKESFTTFLHNYITFMTHFIADNKQFFFSALIFNDYN